jgi:radical SAM superfamily enzyme YgiQ (UPF0313 family)
MRILLLNPTIKSGEKVLRAERCQGKQIVGIWPPMGLAYTASVLREGGFDQIKIIDSVIEDHTFVQMVNRCIRYRPDFILVQNTTPTLKDDLEAMSMIKAKLPEVRIAFYGVQAIAMPKTILSDVVEFAFAGQPEYIALSLCRALKNKAPLSEVEGISYLKGKKIMKNPIKNPIDNIDDIPFPARDLLRNHKYIMPVNGKPFALIKTSRGCPFQCIYCTSRTYYGKQWKSRSPENIIAEIEQVINEYGIKDFFFSSDTFNLRKDLVLRLCQIIRKKRLGIRWVCNSRVDIFDYEIAKAMKSAGCWCISFGLESGSEKILKIAKKGANLAQARRAIAACKKAKIKSIGYFMFGLPGETEKTINQTIDFALSLNPTYAHFYIATPFPGTEFYEMAVRNRWLKSTDWERYFHGQSDVIEYPNIDFKTIERYTKIAYRRFYYRPSLILREAFAIRSFAELKGKFQTFINLVRTWF